MGASPRHPDSAFWLPSQATLLWASPLQAVLAIWLLIDVLGPPALAVRRLPASRRHSRLRLTPCFYLDCSNGRFLLPGLWPQGVAVLFAMVPILGHLSRQQATARRHHLKLTDERVRLCGEAARGMRGLKARGSIPPGSRSSPCPCCPYRSLFRRPHLRH